MKLKLRKKLWVGLEDLAKDLEDGRRMSEQRERDFVRGLADECMEKQKSCGRETSERIQDLKNEISYYKRLMKSSKALWRTMSHGRYTRDIMIEKEYKDRI